MFWKKEKSTLEKIGENVAAVGVLTILAIGAACEAANESDRERRIRNSETREEKALRKASLRMELDRVNIQIRRETDWSRYMELRQQRHDLEDMILAIR